MALDARLYDPVQSMNGSLNAYQAVAVNTNGTTPVSVFPNNQNIIITSVISLSQDTTAGNITLSNNGNTVVVIAKGTVAGVPVAGVSLANTTVANGNTLTVVSSSAGNSTVLITYKLGQTS